MKLLLTGLALLLAPVVSTLDQPEGLAQSWLDDRAESGMVLVVNSETDGFAGQEITGSDATMFVLQTDNWYVNLCFEGEISESTTLTEVREKFSYVALDRLPTPGLVVEGWEIVPQTPVSSFSEGVEILDYRNGRITVRIKTNFFALSGRDTSVEIPLDKAMPEGSYFQIRHEFPLDLTVEAPFAMGG